MNSFEEISPPEGDIPEQPLAKSLGLVRGLRVETAGYQYRCAECHIMQPPDSNLVWVPDGTQKQDPVWSIENRIRQNFFNGHASAWCVSCAPKNKAAEKNGSFLSRITRGLL